MTSLLESSLYENLDERSQLDLRSVFALLSEENDAGLLTVLRVNLTFFIQK